jgi:hypothetical protein
LVRLLNSVHVPVAGSVFVATLLLQMLCRVVMAATWRRGVSSLLLLLLPAVLAELHIAGGTVEELDQGRTVGPPLLLPSKCLTARQVVLCRLLV